VATAPIASEIRNVISFTMTISLVAVETMWCGRGGR
jgi:hypothetical protein